MEAPATRDFRMGLTKLRRAGLLAEIAEQKQDTKIARAAEKLRLGATETMMREATVAHAGDGHPFTRRGCLGRG